MSTENFSITSFDDFKNWNTINDTIMGGSSQAVCKLTPIGLSLEGNLIEENGGFVSCRSPLISPPLDISHYLGLQIDVDGQGRTLKIALLCSDSFSRLTEFISGRVRWVAEVETDNLGTTNVQVPFSAFSPTIRARQLPFPLQFKPHCITQFQLLHSRFGTNGNLNQGFSPGPFRILLRSISAYS
ncbi:MULTISPECIES: CIA30 family protein [unclassified Prochlorococcus]|uniref:CIA30 family protein n=1 Tax=unclassified Prochlorococcus TaxID=2627481 RepID=UPI000533755A|nr:MULTISPECIES: CIA30 family protein [unclassified Prochlorococcus]KGG15163.1 NAD dependent epimerase/dehydratase [Prochlorococcus sp. MIT 0602]KGG17436.1 NAD dependent epimerase/dehydratase [Prochlorococcus sp. MIT 0603]